MLLLIFQHGSNVHPFRAHEKASKRTQTRPLSSVGALLIPEWSNKRAFEGTVPTSAVPKLEEENIVKLNFTVSSKRIKNTPILHSSGHANLSPIQRHAYSNWLTTTLNLQEMGT